MVNNKLRMIATVVVFSLVAFSLPTLAQGTIEIDVVPYVKKKVWFHVTGLDKSQKFQVKIQTEQGDLLFNETFNQQDQYKKVLDFSYAQEGDYYIDLINDRGLVRKVISISDKALVDNSFNFTSGETTELVKTFTKVDEDKVALQVKNSLDSPMSMRILDSSGNVVYKEDSLSDKYGKIYNLSMLDKGTYSVALSAKNYTSYYSVNLGK